MKLLILRENKIDEFMLPERIEGNYWVHYIDKRGKKKDFINIFVSDNHWVSKSNTDIEFVTSDNQLISDQITLEDYQFYFLRSGDLTERFILYCSPNCDTSNILLELLKPAEAITIGRSGENAIIYDQSLVGNTHVKIEYVENVPVIQALVGGVYVNQKMISRSNLKIGDIIFLYGLKIVYMGTFLVINNSNNKVQVSRTIFQEKPIAPNITLSPDLPEVELADLELYKEEDYFSQSPRIRNAVEEKEIRIDAPPAKQEPQKVPLIFTIGPMLTMSAMSLMTGYTAVMGLLEGTRSFNTVLPSLVMCFSMLLGTILLPSLSRRYQKKQKIKREKYRQEKYHQYLMKMEAQIQLEMKKQIQTLNEIYLPLEECNAIIMVKKRTLWERRITDNDFLAVRLGIGVVPAELNIKAPEEHFTLDEDNLLQEVYAIVNKSRDLMNVPVGFSFASRTISSIMGDLEQKYIFLQNLILQLIAFHSYANLKLVFLVDEDNLSRYSYTKVLPHCWDNQKSMRFVATSGENMKMLSSYLEAIFAERSQGSDSNSARKKVDYKNFPPYYIIITDNYKKVKDLGIVKAILNQEENIGFHLLILANRISELPKECNTFMDVHEKTSGLVESDIVSTKQRTFVMDYAPNISLTACSQKLSNIPIVSDDASDALPNMITFLEMYGVGLVDQLNVRNRWRMNDPITSLQAPIGVYPNGELFKLDLHEKFHGPHGLIAGSTGSGKSEFIITYILSMAINYHPNEVQFVLIDYKGGGLAGAFENRETGVKLPHLVGTITNLDTNEMTRSLASIQSELRRRQRMFNQAREALGEATIDIYKYQRLYREGLVQEPISHLFIISDEFAELKSQQPEFMDQLISTARIGRSLGVHLILATQKPSGVVNDQIWSNSKFRVCLKVQGKSDSMDMIKRPDAAMIKETGRFYLQVGYDEFFALGQSAWCGAKYIPTEKVQKKMDDALDFIDEVGHVTKTVNDNNQKIKKVADMGEQLPNVMKYLVNIANEENIHLKQLWLDRIPDFISLEDMKKKYSYQKEDFVLNPIIGEFDDPNNQRQDLLTLPISENGHVAIYGIAGSGKENLLSTIIYSSMITYSPEEVNFYILDLGAETLKMYKDAPHVGDVALSYDKEKITNLFKMLNEEIETRKNLFTDYNGSYSLYCKQSGKTLPMLVTIINNFEAFLDTYGGYEENLLQLTREGAKYGVYFIFSATGINSIRYRLVQNISLKLVLQLNDNSEYSSVIGRTNGVYPSRIAGRGLVRKEDVYEFQTAYISEVEHILETVKQTITALKQQYTYRAKNIPVLPEKVTLDFVRESLHGFSSLPIGVYTEDLNVATLDLLRSPSLLISTTELTNTISFLQAFLTELSLAGSVLSVVIDVEQQIERKLENCMYFNRNVGDVYKFLEGDIVKNFNLYSSKKKDPTVLADMKRVVCVIFGVNKFYNSLTPVMKKNFGTLLTASKEMKKYHFIFIDTPEDMKKLSFETWYREHISSDNGLWIGSGITNQLLIRVNRTTKDMKEEITSSFGFYVKKGVPRFIKLLEAETDDKNEGGAHHEE